MTPEDATTDMAVAPIRILVLSQYFWPEDFCINDVVRALKGKGVEVEALTGKPNYPRGEVFAGYRAWGCQREERQGISVQRVPLFPRGHGGWRLAVNYLSFVLSGLRFAPGRLCGKKIDAILVYASSPRL